MPRRHKDDYDPGLDNRTYWLFALLFLVLPIACVIVSSVLYYSWKTHEPNKAREINNLGFVIFGIQVVGYILYLIFTQSET